MAMAGYLNETAIPQKKACKQCGEIFPLLRFYKSARMKDGHRSTCRYCDLFRQRAWHKANRAKDPEAWKIKDREYKRKYRMLNPGCDTGRKEA